MLVDLSVNAVRTCSGRSVCSCVGDAGGRLGNGGNGSPENDGCSGSGGGESDICDSLLCVVGCACVTLIIYEIVTVSKAGDYSVVCIGCGN